MEKILDRHNSKDSTVKTWPSWKLLLSICDLWIIKFHTHVKINLASLWSRVTGTGDNPWNKPSEVLSLAGRGSSHRAGCSFPKRCPKKTLSAEGHLTDRNWHIPQSRISLYQPKPITVHNCTYIFISTQLPFWLEAGFSPVASNQTWDACKNTREEIDVDTSNTECSPGRDSWSLF